jgi:hypothetical protein
LAAVGWQVYQAIKLISRPKQYALVLETTAGSTAGIVSKDPLLVGGLVELIATSIDKPPLHEIVQHIDNRKLVFGDEINMTGDGIQIGKGALSG